MVKKAIIVIVINNDKCDDDQIMSGDANNFDNYCGLNLN